MMNAEHTMSQIIGGHYEFSLDGESTIGQGGMGTVFRGVDLDTGETVAIKRLDLNLVHNVDEVIERFSREAEALKRLNHPNIVHVRANYDDGKNHYLVMNYVDGGSLRDLMRHTPCLPVERVLKIASPLADALSLAHHHKIIHRDIKPANVLLSSKGVPHLTDFGVARIDDRSRVTKTGMVVGTIGYLSPEALAGVKTDERADIWAFGIMLYEMLAGRHPFEGENTTNMITAIISKDVPPLAKFRVNVPTDLENLIRHMLEKDPDKRVSNMRIVGETLRNIMLSSELKKLKIEDDIMMKVQQDGNLQPVRELIDRGDKAKARLLLRPLLKSHPTADAWYLAALASGSKEQAVKCLKQALGIDSWHMDSNRLLQRLEVTRSLNERPPASPLSTAIFEAVREEITPLEPLSDVKREHRQTAYERRAGRRKLRNRVAFMFILVLMSSCSALTMSFVGLLPGLIGRLSGMMGSGTPVYEIEGVPIEQIPEAVTVMEPSFSKEAADRGMEVLDHGLLHEHTFWGNAGSAYAVYVQFLSLSANEVSSNVALISPGGQDMMALCVRDSILDGDNGITMLCNLNQSGTWKVRVLGIQGESTGAYFIGVQQLES